MFFLFVDMPVGKVDGVMPDGIMPLFAYFSCFRGQIGLLKSSQRVKMLTCVMLSTSNFLYLFF